MDCNRVKVLIEARLDGESVPEGELASHLEACPVCREVEARERRLRDALRQLPVEGPRPGFLDAAMDRATQTGRRSLWRSWPASAAAAGLVAGIALGVIFGGYFPNGFGGATPVSRVELTAGAGAQPVRLLFDAPRDLNGVELTLSVEGDVAIDGYGGQRTLSWRTDLGSGKNLLSLPVRPTGAGSGVVVATLRHEGLQRTFRIQVDVRPDSQDGAAVEPRQGGKGHA